MVCPAPAARLSDTNLFALQASHYLSPEDLLRSEVEESQRKLQVVVETLNFFKHVFQDRRENLHSYFKENQEVREWDFQSSLVFVRLDGFLGRLGMVQVSVLIHVRLPAPCRSGQCQDPEGRIREGRSNRVATSPWLEEPLMGKILGRHVMVVLPEV